MSTRHDDAIDELADLTPVELMKLHSARRMERQREGESGKPHALTAFRLSAEEWAKFKAYVLDGGGVSEDHTLSADILQAVFDDNQQVFWQELPHLLKCRANVHGHTRRLKSGGVSFTGLGRR